MASSVLFDLGGSRGITSGDNPYSTSVTNEATIGYLEFLESDKLKSEKSEQDGSKVRYKILITLEDENNQLCRQLWQKTQTEGSRLPIVRFRALPERLAPLKGRVWLKPGGKLCYDSPKAYLNDSRTSQWRDIFRGYYEYDIPVAIQEIRLTSKTVMTEIEREFQILRQLENHENFIRYFCHEEDASAFLVYVATEICDCSVADLYEPRTNTQIATSQEILQTLRPKTILFQATRGLEYLHSNGYVHRNVKPSSFLIKEVISPTKSRPQYVIKITDFRLSRNALYGGELSGTVASNGWEAPESRRWGQNLKSSLDVFILGCFFHYVIVADEFNEVKRSDEKKPSLHPFENTWGKIINQSHPVYQPGWQPAIINEAAKALIKNMLKFDESKRPSLSQVLEHSFFQTPTSKEFYPMYSYNKPGWCVIFNQENFKKTDGTGHQRIGSQEDCQRLKETFEGLGYFVEVFPDLTSIQLKSEIKGLASKVDLSGYGSLVVCLLSHGFEGHILCSDNVPVNINRLKSKFSLEKCPHLYGKPKIFIVQACQVSLDSTGRTLLRGGNLEIDTLNDAGKRRGFVQGLRGIFGKTSRPNSKLQKTIDGPPLLDFLTIYATLPGSLACRNRKGSYFIQALCDALTEEYLSNEGDDSADKRDLESVLRGDGGVQNLINCKSTETDKTWQTMQWEACLTKYIRFRDYQTENTAIKQRHKEAKPGVINDKPPITEYDSLPAFEFSGSNALVQIALIVIIAAVLFYAFYVD